jgi:hypothetical protein
VALCRWSDSPSYRTALHPGKLECDEERYQHLTGVYH